MNPAERRPQPPRLSEAIAAGLRALNDLTRPPPELLSGELERALRDAAARHQRAEGHAVDGTTAPDSLTTAAAAVRAACAHLATRDYVDAYLALLTAYDTLPAGARIPRTARRTAGPHHENPHPQAEAAQAAAATTQHVVTDQAAINQAVGILAETGDSSVEQAHAVLRGHAYRYGLELAELAADIVAGHVEPAHLTKAIPAAAEPTRHSGGPDPSIAGSGPIESGGRPC